MTAWRRVPAPLAAALVAALFFGAPILVGERFFGLDFSRNLLPMTCAIHQGVKEGEGLALDAAFAGGGPLLEDPEGLVFSPLSWLLLPFSPETAATLFTCVWLVVAAFAASWLGRVFGLTRTASIALGLAHVLSGTTLNLILHGPHVVTAALVPLVWAGARALRRDHGHQAHAILGVVLGLGLLALHGELQAALWAGLIGTAEGIAAMAKRRRRRAVTTLVAALACGTLIAGLQVLPSLDLRSAAARARGVTDLAAWPLELPEAFGVLLPNVALARTDVDATLIQAWRGTRMARAGWNIGPFVGVVALAAALSVVRARRARAPATLALASLVLALGDQTPLYRLALWLCPPLSLFRYPSKYFALTSLALLLLAAIALDVVARLPRVRRTVQVAGAALGALCAAGAAGLFASRTSIDAAALAVAGRAPFPGTASLTTVLVVAAVTSALFGALLVLVLWRRRTAGWAVFILVLELARAAPAALPWSGPWLDGARPRPLLALPADAVLCAGRQLVATHVDAADRDLGAEGDLLADFMDHKTNFQQCGGPGAPHDFLSTSQRPTVLFSRTLLDEEGGVLGPAIALGCTHVSSRGAPSPALVPVALAEAPPFAARIFALTDPLPRATVAPRPSLIADEDELIRRVVGATSAGEVLALVDDPTGRVHRLLPDGTAARVTGARFDGPARGVVELAGTGGAVVVLRQPWWPGWRAQQGGAALDVVRVAGVQLGVVVDDVAAGPVALRYHLPLLPAGVASAALGVGALGVLLVRARARRVLGASG
ncbi:MAG: hypothetical protein HYS27_12685 [Deltaproteobacteria bacterium]|nr:hypothetical protein [Deltaproteobacteria bacterium]